MSVISIITPAYNAEKTILKTIESVRVQTHTHWELIIINDGSQDNTFKVVNSIEDSRIKIFNYPNGGVATARNRGIEKATGDYIAFLDADDFWTPNKLELQLQALQQNPQANVAYSWTYFLYEATGICSPNEPVNYQGNVYTQLLLNNFLCSGSNPLVSRQAINSVGLFDPSFPHCADWDYYLRLAAKWDFVVVPQHQIYYLQSSNSMTSKVAAIEKQLAEMLEKTYRVAPNHLQHLKKQSQAWVYQYCSQQYLEYGKDLQSIREAFVYLSRAVLLYPPICFQNYTHSLVRWLLSKTVYRLRKKIPVAKI